MADVAELATRQVGPLPVYGWLGAVAAGLALRQVLKRRDAQAAADAIPAEPEVGGGEALYPSAAGAEWDTAGLNTTVGGGGGTYAPPAPAVPSITDNVAWQQAAARELVARSYSPLAVNAALSNFLVGLPLTPDQYAMVELAILRVGFPPVPVAPPYVAAEPLPVPDDQPPSPEPPPPAPPPYSPPPAVAPPAARRWTLADAAQFGFPEPVVDVTTYNGTPIFLAASGGVFAPLGNFFGSYFTLPPDARNDPNRRFVSIRTTPVGYEIVAAGGESYAFYRDFAG